MADNDARSTKQPARDQVPLISEVHIPPTDEHHQSTIAENRQSPTTENNQPLTIEASQSPTTEHSQSPITENGHPPSNGSTLFDVDQTHGHENSVAKAEGGITTSVVQSSHTGTLGSDKPSSTSNGSLWKTKALRFAPVRHVVSIVAPDHAESLSSSNDAPKQPRPWRTTLIRFGPLSGIFCMLLAVASLISSLGILAGCNHQPAADWSACR